MLFQTFFPHILLFKLLLFFSVRLLALVLINLRAFLIILADFFNAWLKVGEGTLLVEWLLRILLTHFRILNRVLELLFYILRHTLVSSLAITHLLLFEVIFSKHFFDSEVLFFPWKRMSICILTVSFHFKYNEKLKLRFIIN